MCVEPDARPPSPRPVVDLRASPCPTLQAYAYKRFWFNPRTLRPVGTISMESTILNGRIKTALPIYISPAVRMPASPPPRSTRH